MPQQDPEELLILFEALPDKSWGRMKGLKRHCLTWMFCQTRVKLLLMNAQPFDKQIGLEANEVFIQLLSVCRFLTVVIMSD